MKRILFITVIIALAVVTTACTSSNLAGMPNPWTECNDNVFFEAFRLWRVVVLFWKVGYISGFEGSEIIKLSVKQNGQMTLLMV